MNYMAIYVEDSVQELQPTVFSNNFISYFIGCLPVQNNNNKVIIS